MDTALTYLTVRMGHAIQFNAAEAVETLLTPAHSFASYLREGPSDSREAEAHVLLSLDTLTQVLSKLDGDSLLTTAPLVCRTWHGCAQSSALWVPRLHPALIGLFGSSSSSKTSNPISSAPKHCPGPYATAGSASSALGPDWRPMESSSSSSDSRSSSSYFCRAGSLQPYTLQLIHHAVHGRNFLKNPTFLPQRNSDLPWLMQAWRSSGGTKNHELKLEAWVVSGATGNGLKLEAAAGEGLEAATTIPPAPMAYPSSPPHLQQLIQQKMWQFLMRSPHQVQRPPDAGSVASATAPGPNAGYSLQRSNSRAGTGASSCTRGNTSSSGMSCLATGAEWGEVVQVVDLVWELQRRGLSPDAAAAVLDAGLPLGFSFWVAGSCNTEARFGVCLMLDDGSVPMRSFQSFVRRESSHHFFSRPLAAAAGVWKRYTYVVPACPKGFRRVMVLLRGRGIPEKPEAGGAKFASAELRFLVPEEVAQFQDHAQQWEVSSSVFPC